MTPLTTQHRAILRLLCSRGPQTIREISDTTEIDAKDATDLVAELRKTQYVSSSPVNGGVHAYAATEKARKAIYKLDKADLPIVPRREVTPIAEREIYVPERVFYRNAQPARSFIFLA